ncbi:MAG: hypothetical protein ACLSCV_04895 [Acutalibacteraceae bacterium]
MQQIKITNKQNLLHKTGKQCKIKGHCCKHSCYNFRRSTKPAGRIVDTRTSQVNMDRYNEKYDRLASEKVKTDQTVNKQN